MEYSRKSVADVMTGIEKVFMLESSMKLTFETMMQIYKSGYTRIPVFEGSRNNIMGILYVKDLILVDPDDDIEVQTVVTFRFVSSGRPKSRWRHTFLWSPLLHQWVRRVFFVETPGLC